MVEAQLALELGNETTRGLIPTSAVSKTVVTTNEMRMKDVAGHHAGFCIMVFHVVAFAKEIRRKYEETSLARR